MALSNSTDFSLNRDEVINKALELVGAKEPGLTPSSTEISDAAEWLNMMLKEWQTATQNSLWVRKTGTIILQKDKQSYNLGTGTYAARGTVTETTLDAAEAASQTVISVTSTSGFTNSDNIGILLDDDTIHWSTIDSFVTDDTVTIASGLPSAAASGNNVWVYTNVAHRPQRIMELVLRNTSDEDTPLEELSQQEYMELSDKDNSGDPSSYFLDMQLGDAVLYLWPVIDANDYKVVYKYVKQYDDMDASTDDLEFPVEWTMAIVYGLAMHLATVYSVDDATYGRIAGQAARTFKRANSYDIENTSVEFEPDIRGEY